MRKLIVLAFVLLFGAVAVQIFNPKALQNPRSLLFYSPCDDPLGYRIGTVDERFGLTHDELADDIEQANALWSDEWGKKLFVYDPKAKLSINMLYDKRQSLNQEIENLQTKLDQNKTAVNFEILDFETRSQAFKEKVAEFNKKVDYWNEKGGAPKEEYDGLTKTQSDLKKESEELSVTAKRLNQSTSIFNSQVSELNETVNSFNSELATRPEEGLYRPYDNSIEIYLTNSQNELVHTLAHEMGHALSMEHVLASSSIMYKSTNDLIELSDDDISQLKFVCRERSTLEGLLIALRPLVQKQN